LAVGLTSGEHSHDADELLEAFKLPFEGCMLMAQRGELLIVKPCHAERYLKQSHD